MEDIQIECNDEEKITRLTHCKNCKYFLIESETITKCTECNCNISLLITYKFKSCPKDYW